MRRIEEREAKFGKRMIEVKVRFWTNNIAEKEGEIRPKVCWERGVVRMERNNVHGITPEYPVPFNSMTEILPKIEHVLKIHGIKVVRTKTAKGLYTTIDKIC